MQVKTIYNFNTLQELYDQGINFVNKILPDFIYHNVEELEEYWVHYMGRHMFKNQTKLIDMI